MSKNEWKYVATVEANLDSRLPLVPCLAPEMGQVILNLVVNAAQAITEAKTRYKKSDLGHIRVSTRQLGKFAEIRIQDTGTGLAQDIGDKIFDPFFTTKDVGVGTGQGLTIARSIVVDKHGGTIDFESVVGEGTTFIVCLPLEVEETTKPDSDLH
jgi:signal transduction histidine kinase